MKSKSTIFFFLFVLIVMLLVLPTFSYAFRDFVFTYDFSPSKYPDNYFMTRFTDMDTYKSFFTIVDPYNALSWILMAIGLGSILIRQFGLLEVKPKFNKSEKYGSHGTSRWQTLKEIKKHYYKDNTGWFLGSVEPVDNFTLKTKGAVLPVKGKLNKQVTVIGNPGSYKSTGVVLPNLFHIPNAYKDSRKKPDIIATDTKGELFELTASYYEKEGYEVRVLDFINFKYGDSLNVIDFVSDDKELMEIADGYVKSYSSFLGGDKRSDQAFWDDNEGQVLGALIGFMKQVYPGPMQTFTDVARLLTCDEVSSISKAKLFFADHGIKGAPLQLWKNFLMVSDSDRTRANILGGLATKLKLFAVDGVQKITAKTTLDITQFGSMKDKPIILYMLLPDEDKTFSPIANITITTLMNQLYKTARTYPRGKLYNPVYLIIEEMYNIGALPTFKDKLSSMRGRDIMPMMIWQDLSQMEELYGKGWRQIMSMCDTHIYLGMNDELTQNTCSKALGQTTIQVQGLNRTAEGLFGTNKTSENQNYHQRPLLFPDECKYLDTEQMIVIHNHRYPALFYKVQYKSWDEYEDKMICPIKRIEELPTLGIFTPKDIGAEDVIKFTEEEIIRSNPLERIGKPDVQLHKTASVDKETDEEISVDFESLNADVSIFEELENEFIKDKGIDFDN